VSVVAAGVSDGWQPATTAASAIVASSLAESFIRNPFVLSPEAGASDAQGAPIGGGHKTNELAD
jgi:hypothetical protein